MGDAPPPTLPPGATYRPGLLTPEDAAAHLEALLEEVSWQQHHFRIFGKEHAMPRRIQMYGPFGYEYSGVQHPPRALTPTLERLRAEVQRAAGVAFNSVLANLYRDGADSMGWHTDDDYPHGGQPMIASLSLGAARRFRFRHRRDKGRTSTVVLEPGSLLTIDDEARTDWQHALPKSRRVDAPRVNLTFRHMTGS